jgi:hypothetical protein
VWSWDGTFAMSSKPRKPASTKMKSRSINSIGLKS